MKYSNIRTESGKQVPHSTVRGLALACRRKALTPGIYICQCPGGNVHTWEIEHSSTHTSVGYAPRKKAARLGKGIAIYNYTAKLKKVSRV